MKNNNDFLRPIKFSVSEEDSSSCDAPEEESKVREELPRISDPVHELQQKELRDISKNVSKKFTQNLENWNETFGDELKVH